MIFPDFIFKIIKRIEGSGFEAYAVGGCVRDYILGKTPNDWDIATSATPDEIMTVFEDIPTIPTGIKHGTVTVISDNIPVEITTYRIDGEYTDNRRPETVTFSQSITDDLSRRDFTVNAMAFNPKSGLIDPFGGQTDIQHKLLRCVGDPEKRFHEDALRIMRAIRFCAVLGFDTEPDTKAAIFDCRELLTSIAAERISSELEKLVMAENPAFALDEFLPVFADILYFDAVKKADVWKRNSKLVGRCPKHLPIRLAILFDGLYDDNMDISVLFKALKFDNKTVSTTKFLCEQLYTKLPDTEIPMKKLLSKTKPDLLRLLLKTQLVRFFDKTDEIEKSMQCIDKIISENQCFSLKSLSVSGTALQADLGIKGIQIGIVLNALLDAVIEGKCKNTYADLIKYAKGL